jgi:hypothetical protein
LQYCNATRFASTPSELLKLADFYEKDSSADVAKSQLCCENVIKNDPKKCHIALIRKAKLILQAAGGDEKKNAKNVLLRAKNLIEQKSEKLTAANGLIKKTTEAHKKAGGAQMSENLFEEQITNIQSLLQVHVAAIDDLLGRTVRQSIASQFSKEEEANESMEVVTGLKELCKPFRLSKKASVVEDELLITKTNGTSQNQSTLIEWPSSLIYCKNDTIRFIKEKRSSLLQSFDKSNLTDVIVTQDQLWEALIEEGVVGNESIIEKDVIRWSNLEIDGESAVKDFLSQLPDSLTNIQSVLVDWLQHHENEDFVTAAAPFKLTDGDLASLKEFLTDKKILVHIKERHGQLLTTITVGQTASIWPEKLVRYDCLLTAWILHDVDDAENVIGAADGRATIEAGKMVFMEHLPCPVDSTEGVNQLWNHLVGEGAIKV